MPVFRHALTCPRCPLALIEVTTPRITRHTCNGCGGVWIDDDDLRRLFEELALDPAAPLGPLELATGPLRCPRCREAMAVERTLGAEPTALVDVCAAHGAWFDRDELAHALHQLQLARLEKERGPYHDVPDELKVLVWLYRLFRRDEPEPIRTRGRPD
jgi:Zn-finger nucleic acid-binding protein